MNYLVRKFQNLSPEQRFNLMRILISLLIFVIIELLPLKLLGLPSIVCLWIQFVLFLIPYLIAGSDVIAHAYKGVIRGHLFDENVLMVIATVGAFALVFFPESDPHMAEGAAVMIFYQTGEWFHDYALDQSRSSIKSMMNIAPAYAYRIEGDVLTKVKPQDIEVGQCIMVKPGERIALDGEIINGYSQIDTSAITGEALPRLVHIGSSVVSGCVNLSGALTIKVTKQYEDSTVQRILDLVENASTRKAHAEHFISRFAHIYTPVIVCLAALLAFVPPLMGYGSPSTWIQRALIFLVVSCPCALVISVPLSFFGGIGASSKQGILIKGSNYLETLAVVDTVAFDKTGTLTTGKFGIITVHPVPDIARGVLLRIAAHVEVLSNHPTAQALRQAYTAGANPQLVTNFTEHSGKGVSADFEGHRIAAGNLALMEEVGIHTQACEVMGTTIHAAQDGVYLGHIVIADSPKDDASQTILNLHKIGVERCVMLTGDRIDVAKSVCQKLGMDEFHAELMPQDKVAIIEKLIRQEDLGGKLAFVGDGINDAPVLMRSDVGIAMGAMGSDAAIEAADVVLMNDKPSGIATAINIARKTMRIVRQNIVVALGVKVLILGFAALGIANMWVAVFGDVGVACLAVANAMRCLRVNKSKIK